MLTLGTTLTIFFSIFNTCSNRFRIFALAPVAYYRASWDQHILLVKWYDICPLWTITSILNLTLSRCFSITLLRSKMMQGWIFSNEAWTTILGKNRHSPSFKAQPYHAPIILLLLLHFLLQGNSCQYQSASKIVALVTTSMLRRCSLTCNRPIARESKKQVLENFASRPQSQWQISSSKLGEWEWKANCNTYQAWQQKCHGDSWTRQDLHLNVLPFLQRDQGIKPSDHY